jgi:hypothetical protein
MIEVQCPRCLQYWYSREEVTGRERLCSACADRQPRKRRGGLMKQLGVFAVVAAVLLAVDGVWIGLTACWPGVFGVAMLIYGCVLSCPCVLWFSAVLRASRWTGAEMDWTIHRWPLLIGLTGLACVLAFFSLVHPFQQ